MHSTCRQSFKSILRLLYWCGGSLSGEEEVGGVSWEVMRPCSWARALSKNRSRLARERWRLTSWDYGKREGGDEGRGRGKGEGFSFTITKTETFLVSHTVEPLLKDTPEMRIPP